MIPDLLHTLHAMTDDELEEIIAECMRLQHDREEQAGEDPEAQSSNQAGDDKKKKGKGGKGWVEPHKVNGHVYAYLRRWEGKKKVYVKCLGRMGQG